MGNSYVLLPEIVLPQGPPTLKGMRLLRDREIAEAVVGKKIGGGAVSYYENYAHLGLFILEQDLGIIRRGGWAIGEDALCAMAHGDPRPICRRLYRAPDGTLFQIFPGREAEPVPLNIEGPITIR